MSCCPEHKTDKGEEKQNHHHGHHNHGMGHAGLEAGKDFLNRFFIVSFLLIPLFLLNKTVLSFLGLADFAWRKYLQFGVASIIFYFALVFFEHASHEIKARKYGMMTLVSLAVGAGYLFSASSTFIPAFAGVEFYLEISTLIWVLLFGHYLEARSSSAAGNALEEVAKLLPKEVHRIKIKPSEAKLKREEAAGEYEDIEVEELRKGDWVLVKPGEKVPADGVIVKGEANIDQSLISGESKPVPKKVKDEVVAGSICLDGSIYVQVNRVGEASTIGQIKKLISEAQKTKPTAQKIADKAASVLTFTALLIAVLTVLVWSFLLAKPFVFSLTLAITVLVIACPHALGLAIPTVSTIATSLAVKNGVFLKDLGKLELVKDIDYVVFDKTGTLTKGEFTVLKFQPLTSNIQGGPDYKQLLSIAASLEKRSTHPIAAAIVNKAKEEKVKTISVEGFKNIAGKGVKGTIQGRSYFLGTINFAQTILNLKDKAVRELNTYANEGRTTAILFDQEKVLAVILLGDRIKRESFKAVKSLHRLGVKVAMLTGDNQKTAEEVAKRLGIDDYFAQVLPEDKYKHIKRLQEKGNKVIMVGDGVNDAPALTQADVGVAVGAGTDVAVEAGDVVLTRNNPQDIVRLLVLARKVYRKMVENLIWALGYNIIAIPAAAGLFSPLGVFLKPEWGAILMSLSSVIVVINALRLRKVRLEV